MNTAVRRLSLKGPFAGLIVVLALMAIIISLAVGGGPLSGYARGLQVSLGLLATTAVTLLVTCVSRLVSRRAVTRGAQAIAEARERAVRGRLDQLSALEARTVPSGIDAAPERSRVGLQQRMRATAAAFGDLEAQVWAARAVRTELDAARAELATADLRPRTLRHRQALLRSRGHLDAADVLLRGLREGGPATREALLAWGHAHGAPEESQLGVDLSRSRAYRGGQHQASRHWFDQLGTAPAAAAGTAAHDDAWDSPEASALSRAAGGSPEAWLSGAAWGLASERALDAAGAGWDGSPPG